MGWAYGVNQEGREIGYGVEATCDLDGCDEQIDRGLWHVCGGMHDGGEHGCGRYFCGSHIFHALGTPDQMCEACLNAFKTEHPDAVEEAIAEFEKERAARAFEAEHGVRPE